MRLRLSRDPVTIGLTLMLALIVALTVAQYVATRYATRDVDQQSYNRCMDRKGNTDRLNAFVRRMTVLEGENQFIDQRLRDARVAAYAGLVFAAPKCGSKP